LLLSEGKALVVEWGLAARHLRPGYSFVLIHISLLARRRRADSRDRSQISAPFLNINSGVRDAAADDGVEFVGAQFEHCQSPDVPGRAYSSP
jgi:hypothetical protein